MEKEKISEKIVDEIISNLNDRSGCNIDSFDFDTQQEIKTQLIKIVLKYL